MARGGGGVGDGRRVGARIGGGTRLVAPAMIVGRASRGRAGAAARRRAARPLERAATPGAEKNKRENQKRGPNLTGPGPRTGRVLTRPRRSSRSGRCLWPDAPPACRTRTFRWTTSVPTRSHARSTDPTSSNQKESLRPFAQRVSRLKFRAPRPDRRARSCCDASVSVDPPRVRLFVNGCGMSEAELGRITGVVRGALPPQSRGVPTRGVSNQ